MGLGMSYPKEGYFWTKERNLKWLKAKPKVYTDSIKKGYYADVEHLTFVDKKLALITYRNKNNEMDTVKTFKDGNGFLRRGMDTVSIKDGMLNGRSAHYSLYVINHPTFKNPQPDTLFASDWQCTVMNYAENMLLSVKKYRRGILLHETYYKNCNVFRDYMGNGSSQFIDSERIYRENGQLKSIYTKKGGYKYFPG